MTDVLYIVRGDSPELRFSLRSLERNASNLGRVAVAGTDLPKWLSPDVERLEVQSPFRRKQQNIMFALLESMRLGLVRRPFLCSSDDHYTTAPTDFDAYPWYVRGHGYPTEPGGRMTAWRMSIIATGELLRRAKLPCGLRLDGHWNSHVDPADCPFAMRWLAGFWATPWGYDPTSFFVACGLARGLGRPTVCKDSKITEDREPDGARPLLSAAKLSRLPRLRAWLEKEFPEPSRWERS